jgi:hypothetical protein
LLAGETAGDLKGLSKHPFLYTPRRQRLLHRLGKKKAVKEQMSGAQHRCCLCSLFSEFISILCAFMFGLIVDDRLKTKMKNVLTGQPWPRLT